MGEGSHVGVAGARAEAVFRVFAEWGEVWAAEQQGAVAGGVATEEGDATGAVEVAQHLCAERVG